METDEQAIRNLVATWIEASKKGDNETVLGLMADDVVFLLPGRQPMRGKGAFAAAAEAQSKQRPFKFDAISEIQEIKVFGEWAYLWTKLSLTIVPIEGGAPVKREGNTLSILKKQSGKWLLFRDANMLAAAPN